MSPNLPPKKSVALALLENTSVFIHLDPRGENVRVPTWFKKQPQLVLQVGLNMPVPIPDLHLDDESVSCTLSFNRSPFYCHIPWEAVFALVGENRRGMVWPDDVPREVAVQLQRQAAKAAAQQKEQPQSASPKRPHLRAVPTGGASGEKQAAAAEPVKPAEQPEGDSQGEAPVAPPAGRTVSAAEETGSGEEKAAKKAAGTKKAAKTAKKTARAATGAKTTAKKATKAAKTAKKTPKTASKAGKKTVKKAAMRKAAKDNLVSARKRVSDPKGAVESASRQPADTSTEASVGEPRHKPSAVQEPPSAGNGVEAPPSSPPIGGEPSSSSEADGPKSKRKLPPYLRVVK